MAPEAQFRMSAAPARPSSPPHAARSPARRSRTCAATASCPPSSSAAASTRTACRSTRTSSRRCGATPAPNTLIDLSIDGDKPRPSSCYGVQTHRVTRRPLHVDLYVVRMTEELTVDVPLVLRGPLRRGRERSAARCSTSSSTSASARCRTTCRSRSTTRSSRSRTFDDAIHVRDLAIPERRDAADRRSTRSSPRSCRRASRRSRSWPRPPRARRAPRARRVPRAPPRRPRASAGGRGRRGRPRTRADRPQPACVPSRRRSAVAASARRRSAPSRRARIGARCPRARRLEVGEQRLLVELREEREVALRVPCVGASPRPTRARRGSPPVAWTPPRRPGDAMSPRARVRLRRVEAELVEDLVGDAIRLERAVRPLPGDPGHHAARPQDAANLAQCRRAARDELEHERRHRGVERRRRRTAARSAGATRRRNRRRGRGPGVAPRRSGRRPRACRRRDRCP